MTMTTAQHRSESARYRRLHAETGITAYSVAASHHAAMSGDGRAFAFVDTAIDLPAIHQDDEGPAGFHAEIIDAIRDAEQVRALRASDLSRTQELPAIETTEDLRRDLAARLAVRS